MHPIAIAKDGHIIWGMYNSNGALWGDCDVDVCNGATIDGYYGYAATSFHPYIVGCWGPGNYPTVSQLCSDNARYCSSSSSSTSSTTTVAAYASLLEINFVLLTLLSMFSF